MKKTFCFILKALFVLKVFKLLSRLFVMLKKRLDTTSIWQDDKQRLSDKMNFKIHDITTWLTDNCNCHIVQYLMK